MTQARSSYSCSFCEVASERVVAGPKDYICFSCVAAYSENPVSAPAGTHGAPSICAFCGLAEPKVSRVLSGAKASICDGCLKLCNDIRAGRA
jgi:ClpX C4-type zinc finger protein